MEKNWDYVYTIFIDQIEFPFTSYINQNVRKS